MKGVVDISRAAQMLLQFWKASGKTKTFLSMRLGVSRPRLNYIFKHPESSTWEQAEVLSEELNLKREDKKQIFLPLK